MNTITVQTKVGNCKVNWKKMSDGTDTWIRCFAYHNETGDSHTLIDVDSENQVEQAAADAINEWADGQDAHRYNESE